MNEKKKRISIFLSALLLSAALSVAVFAVSDYDSTTDPLISQSYLIKYINENVISKQDTKFEEIESRILALEKSIDSLLNNYTPPSDTGSENGSETSSPDTGDNSEALESIAALSEKLSKLETLLDTLSSENDELSGKYDTIQTENAAIKSEIASLKQQINDYIEENSKEDIAMLKEQYNSLLAEISSLKSSTSSIQSSFSDISKSYVALQKEVYNLNQTLKELANSDSSVLADLLQLSSKVTELGNSLSALATENMTFELIKLDKGDKIIANGSVSAMLQYGDATAISPESQFGTSIEFTDLTSGELIKAGDKIPLNHNIFIPGNGRAGVVCTGEHGIYIFVGGDYTVIKAEVPNE